MSDDNRELTTLEKSYLRSFQLRLTLLKWILLLFGATSLVLGLVLPPALIFARQDVSDIQSFTVIATSLFIFATGLLFTGYGLRQSLRPKSKSTQLRGTLLETRIYVRGSAYYRYFINDIQICWPPGAEDIIRPLIGTYVSLRVAMIEIEPHARLNTILSRFSRKTIKRQPSGYGIVLNHQTAINIHKTLKKYGRHYLLLHQIKWVLGLGLWTAFTLFIATRPYIFTTISKPNIFLFLLMLIGYLIASGTTLIIVIKSYQNLRKRLNPQYNETPHEERLKGN